jgi:hypothetical protein
LSVNWTDLAIIVPGIIVAAETGVLIFLALRGAGRVGGKVPAGFIVGRANFNLAIAQMFDRAKPGDTIFGECRRCTDLGEPFYSHLPAVLARGARLHVMISQDGASVEGARYFLGLQNSQIRAGVLGPLRIIGIAGKEAFLLVDRSGEYVGLHFADKSVARSLYRTFETDWKHATVMDAKTILQLDHEAEPA